MTTFKISFKRGLFFLLFMSFGISYSQQKSSDELPIYSGENLKIDTKRLRPFRLQYWPRSRTIDSLFRNAQVSHTIERGDYYDDNGNVKQGIRIRWVSNTHGFEDKAYVDASTFRIIKNTASINIKKSIYAHAYFGENMVTRTILRNDSAATSMSKRLNYNDYYHLIIMPYLFASSNLEAGIKFQLPFYSSVTDKESLIEVYIIGSVEYVDKYGQNKKAWRVDTDHGYAKLEWYLDKNNPPYLLAYKWITKKNGKSINESKESMTKWWVYEGDDFDQITIQKN